MNEEKATREGSSAPGEQASRTAGSARGNPVIDTLRAYFWLDEPIARAKKRAFSSKDPGWLEFSWGRQTRAARAQLGNGGEQDIAVLALERAEALFLLRCHCVRAGLRPPTSLVSEETWQRALTLPVVEHAWSELTGGEQSAVRAVLGDDAEFSLVHASESQRERVASGLRRFSALLAAPLDDDANAVPELRWKRWKRLTLALLVLAALVLGVTLRSKPNLALHRPVSVTSQFGDAGKDHSLLVDGNRTTLGCHTESLPNQHVTIDLGESRAIQRVVVANRGDCCAERAVPLLLEVSDDGEHFRKLAERLDTFDIWNETGLATRARYVRLRLLATNFLHLAEVEVY